MEEPHPSRRHPDLPQHPRRVIDSPWCGFSWCCRCCIPSRAHLCLPTRAQLKEDTGLLLATAVGTCKVCGSFPKRPSTSSTSSPGRSHEAGPRGASSFLPSKSRCCPCHRALGLGADLWLCAAGWMLSSSLLKPGELAALRQSSFQLSKLSF